MSLPDSAFPAEPRERGFILYDIVGPERVSRFFRAPLRDGALDVRACLSEGTVA